ncbi:MAG TPA: glycine cleavage system protein H [Chloroflexi bacterium]|nr:glycine cleavage system protein H [Chloroflexota bacterium]
MVETEYLEAQVDKFVFKVKRGCYYTEEGIWMQVENGAGRVGVSDFLQQKSGDVAFANLPELGSTLKQGQGMGSIETIKADVTISSPISGVVQETNRELEIKPELINEDPYGEGWLVLIEMSDFESDRKNLLTAEEYLAVMKSQAEEEAKKR